MKHHIVIGFTELFTIYESYTIVNYCLSWYYIFCLDSQTVIKGVESRVSTVVQL
jgi:hypothetical protein